MDLNLADDDGEPSVHTLQATLEYAQISEKIAPDGQRGANQTKFVYEAKLNYHRIRALTDLHSEEAATHRGDKDAFRYREGVSRCLPPSQIVSGRHQCTDQTLRSGLPSNRIPISLTSIFQECKDVEEKLRDLIPWLTKLKGSMMTTRADENHEDVERREQLTRSVTYHLTD